MMRLFVALEVPEDVRDRVAAATAQARRRDDHLRWSRPDAWHLTLAFLGEVDEGRRGEVEQALRAAVTGTPPAIGLSLADPARFGNRVLWLGVDDEPQGAVAGLGERLQERLAQAGLPVDRKAVHPHLTLARSRRRGRGRGVTDAVVSRCPRVEAPWSVDHAVLYRSHLGGGPAQTEGELASGAPRHEVLARLPFCG